MKINHKTKTTAKYRFNIINSNYDKYNKLIRYYLSIRLIEELISISSFVITTHNNNTNNWFHDQY